MERFKHGGERRNQEIVLDFSININPMKSPKRVMSSLKKASEESLHYPDITCKKLRRSVEEFLNISEGQLVCGNGASEILHETIRLLSPKHALLVAPTFSEYEWELLQTGCKIQYEYLKAEHNFEIPSSFPSRITEDLDVVVLCNPNNPVGNAIEKSLLSKILGRCQEKNIFVIVDECFLPFLEDYTERTCLQVIEKYENLLVLQAFTKTFSMPGVRLGFGISGNVAFLHRLSQAMPAWNVSTFAQAAGLAATKEKKWFYQSRDYLQRERDAVKDALKKMTIKVYPSQANFLLFQAREDLKEQILKSGILLRSCGNYRGLDDTFFRMAIKNHEENQILLDLITNSMQTKQNNGIQQAEQNRQRNEVESWPGI